MPNREKSSSIASCFANKLKCIRAESLVRQGVRDVLFYFYKNNLRFVVTKKKWSPSHIQTNHLSHENARTRIRTSLQHFTFRKRTTTQRIKARQTIQGFTHHATPN